MTLTYRTLTDVCEQYHFSDVPLENVWDLLLLSIQTSQRRDQWFLVSMQMG